MSLKIGTKKSKGPEPKTKCPRCSYAMLPEQRRCPECGFIPAPKPTGRLRVVQLYQQGPQAVWPIAVRFFVMGALAALGPFVVIGALAYSFFVGGGGLWIGTAIAWCIAPLPLVVLLSMPRGWGSLGGEQSQVPVERVRVLGIPVHKIALATSACWWILAALITFMPPFPFNGIVFVVAAVGAAASAYFHLNWLADLGLAVSDEGPLRTLNICISIAMLSAIVAILIAAFVSNWGPVLVALLLVVLAVVLGEIWAAMQLGRDMIVTLADAYEELNREARRAARAAEHEPRFPV